MDDEVIGEDIHLYIMTPYLIMDSDMTNALIFAAKRGVDVRIVISGILDKNKFILWQLMWGIFN